MATSTLDPTFLPKPTGGGGTTGLPQLSTQEVAYFQNQRRIANNSFGRGIVDINLQRGRLGVDEQFATQDLTDQFDAAREPLTGSFNRRGLLDSGIFKNALSDFFTQKTGAFDRLDVAFERQFTDLDITEDDLNQQLTNALSSIAADENVRRSVYAEIIRGLQ